MSVDDTFKDKHLWVKKATDLEVTEFMLRLMAWLCTRDETFDGSLLLVGLDTSTVFKNYWLESPVRYSLFDICIERRGGHVVI
ncbi:MAG: hypothetical protein ACHQ1D_07130 [Nitrososphaerales archaeon]